MRMSLSRHTLRQLNFAVPGAFLTWYFDTHRHYWVVLTNPDNRVARGTAQTILVLGISTITGFLYVLLLPILKGIEPNYRSWRDSGELSVVIPTITTTIIVGWLLFVFLLGYWSDLGYLESVLAVSGIYALTFALLGLVPAPKLHRS